MKIVFFDHCGFPYHAGTPFEKPLGGSQSALCYLAIELAQRGHEVTLYTPIDAPVTVRGVHCLPHRTFLDGSVDEPVDAMLFLNGPVDVARWIRTHRNPRSPLLLWTQHATDQESMRPLADPILRSAWDGIICISSWQRQTMIEQYGVVPERTCILGNAVAPVFRGLFLSADDFATAKAGPPVLAYTSTPYRGLNVLLAAFPFIRARHPDVELRIFSSMAVYQAADGDYEQLYERAKGLPGVTYVGSLPQPALARALRAATVLAYPNTFPETYCTSAIEALAAGLHVVTSDLGALPETTMGFATLVGGGDRDLGQFARDFIFATCAILDRRAADPAAFAAGQFQQVLALEARCTWPMRAAEWERMLASAATLTTAQQ